MNPTNFNKSHESGRERPHRRRESDATGNTDRYMPGYEEAILKANRIDKDAHFLQNLFLSTALIEKAQNI
ncbi:MAG: hypothetical protein IT389_09275 [Nitrospira sp.]|nr:hypothetical protein [Nitrospira sp.]